MSSKNLEVARKTCDRNYLNKRLVTLFFFVFEHSEML